MVDYSQLPPIPRGALVQAPPPQSMSAQALNHVGQGFGAYQPPAPAQNPAAASPGNGMLDIKSLLERMRGQGRMFGNRAGRRGGLLGGLLPGLGAGGSGMSPAVMPAREPINAGEPRLPQIPSGLGSILGNPMNYLRGGS